MHSVKSFVIFPGSEGDSPSHTHTHIHTIAAEPGQGPQVLCTSKAAVGAAIFLLDCKVTSDSAKKKKGGVMKIGRTRKSLQPWSWYCSTLTDPQSLTVALSFVLPSCSHAHSLSLHRDFTSLCLALSRLAVKHTLLATHTPPPFLHLSRSLFPPSPVSCQGCHFLAPAHLLQVTIAEEAIYKGRRAQSEHTHTA